ncbi:hypothetical protein Dip510_001116 [Elusimicrobium posterum]|uniref:hypothetical protein n=1 Tax=Elusimicrobium posterum TaxID=3116653 RepID=UPI003C712646
MKKISLFSVIVLTSLLLISCSSNKKVEEEPYNRTGSAQEVENQFRNKVFAPISGEGRFYATYSLAEIVDGPDSEEYYTVKFINGPAEGKKMKTRDIILKTEPLPTEEMRKGQVVLRDFFNKGESRKSVSDRWNKAVIHDVSRLKKENKIVLEFPHDRNDFMATRETVYAGSVRLITKPESAAKDPRTFIP